LSDISEDIVNFIDNSVLTTYIDQRKKLYDYIASVSQAIVSQAVSQAVATAVGNYINANYTLVDNAIAEKLNYDKDLKTANSLKEYIKSVVNESYIKSIINEEYIRSFID